MYSCLLEELSVVSYVQPTFKELYEWLNQTENKIDLNTSQAKEYMWNHKCEDHCSFRLIQYSWEFSFLWMCGAHGRADRYPVEFSMTFGLFLVNDCAQESNRQ